MAISPVSVRIEPLAPLPNTGPVAIAGARLTLVSAPLEAPPVQPGIRISSQAQSLHAVGAALSGLASLQEEVRDVPVVIDRFTNASGTYEVTRHQEVSTAPATPTEEERRKAEEAAAQEGG